MKVQFDGELAQAADWLDERDVLLFKGQAKLFLDRVGDVLCGDGTVQLALDGSDLARKSDDAAFDLRLEGFRDDYWD